MLTPFNCDPAIYLELHGLINQGSGGVCALKRTFITVWQTTKDIDAAFVAWVRQPLHDRSVIDEVAKVIQELKDAQAGD